MIVAPCKICATPAPLHGVTDRARSCEIAQGRCFPLTGEAVWYHRCPACGFLFTCHFDGWDFDRWRVEVYNDHYGEVDPDYADGSRASNNAAEVISVAAHLGAQRVLDYGGGQAGDLAAIVRLTSNLHAVSWDPVFDAAFTPTGTFDLVTAFEVFEHSPTPRQTLADVLAFVRPGGSLLFTTLTLDSLPAQAMDHWYIAPACGHVSLHTTASLDRLFAAHGLTVRHLSEHAHMVELPG